MLSGAADFCRGHLPRVTEGHVKSVSDVRPKFPEDVETHACRESIGTYPQGGSNPAFVSRMESIVEGDSGCRTQPLRNIEHVFAAVSLRDKSMLDCMEETLPAAAMNQGVVSRNRRLAPLHLELLASRSARLALRAGILLYVWQQLMVRDHFREAKAVVPLLFRFAKTASKLHRLNRSHRGSCLSQCSAPSLL